jgi:hypothetical protein
VATFPPPPVGDNPAYLAKTFTTFTADIDLTAQSGYPMHGAIVEVVNSTAGSLAASLSDNNNNTFQCTVPAALSRVPPVVVRKILAATADTMTEITAYWWVNSATKFNP